MMQVYLQQRGFSKLIWSALVQVLVGLRSGAMLRAALQPAAGATGKPSDEVDTSVEAVPGGDADMADAETSEGPQPPQPSAPTNSLQLKQVPMYITVS
jgi:hypothetical protein